MSSVVQGRKVLLGQTGHAEVMSRKEHCFRLQSHQQRDVCSVLSSACMGRDAAEGAL